MARFDWRSVLVILACLSIFAMATTSVVGESMSSAWAGLGRYPSSVELQSCVSNSDFSYIYCIGGFDGLSYMPDVRYSSLPLGSSSSWSSTTSYPQAVAGQSCVTHAVYIYCVGGYNSGTRTNAVYYSQPSSTGTGAWQATSSYPTSIQLQSCVVYSGDIYCVGGFDGRNYLNSTYYAQLSLAGGVNSWSKTKSYPDVVEGQSCVVDSGYIYCIGGDDGIKGLSSVYYAQLSTGGIGTWKNTTSYPTTVYGQSCAVESHYVYCVGGYTAKGYTSATYYAGILPTGGLGAWTAGTPYPVSIELESCLAYSGVVYCVGGFDGNSVRNSAYSNAISTGPVTVTSTSTSTFTTSVSNVTVTRTVTTPSIVNHTVTATVTSTTTTSTQILATTVSTRTAFSISVTTTAVTSTTTMLSGVTTTVTVGSEGGGVQSTPILWSVGAGLAGVALAAAVVYFLTRSKREGVVGKRAEGQTPQPARPAKAATPQSELA